MEKEESGGLAGGLPSPRNLLLLTVLFIAGSELAVMHLLPHLPEWLGPYRNIADAVVLALLIVPFLYFFLYRPLARQISDHHAMAREVALRNSLLDMINRAQAGFISSIPSHAVLGEMLRTVVDLTASGEGIIGEVVGAEGELSVRTLSAVWESGDSSPTGDEAEPIVDTPLFSAAMGRMEKTLLPVIFPSPSFNPAIPGGIALSLLAIPLLSGGRLIGVCALVNRRQGYSEKDLTILSPFAVAGGAIIEAWRKNEEHRRAEERVASAMVELREVFKALPDLYFRVNADGMILDYNVGAGTTICRNSEPMHGKAIWEMLPAESGPLFKGALYKMMRDGALVTFEFAPSTSGKAAVFETRILPVLAGDAVVIVRDVSDRKRTEEELKKAKESAEEAVLMNNRFISLVAHDLKQPLSSLYLTLMYIERDNRFALNQEGKELMGHMAHTVDGLINMIEELLDMSRLQMGKLVPAPRHINAFAAVAAVKGRMLRNAKKKGIEVTNLVPPDAKIYADPELFGEVLHNLLSNAIKFTPRGGKVEVFMPPDEPNTVVVKDTGTGVDLEILPHIFSHGVKTTTKGTAGEKGTGLGLPFSHDIMKAHGGSLTVKTKKGDGTAFYARLGEARPKVLLVDDDKADRVLFRHFVNRTDVEILEAASGHEALALLENERPSVVLADVNMPGMDGLELLERIRANQRTKDIPVIIVTGDMHMETREKSFRLGADDFVMKPLQAEEINLRVGRFI
ncbi:MAG: response regulator [Nitrospinae bacterium]|nr:response regulator [Nitrospinota bacterium]